MTDRHPIRLAVLATLVVALVVACGSAPKTSWTYGTSITSSPGASPGASAGSSAAPSAAASPASSSSTPPASATPSASAGASPDGYTVVGTKPCPNGSQFECVTLAVPKDHFAAEGGETWDVTFAIRRATKAKQGTFVVITGGPGSSGISSADDYTSYYAQAITDSYDIVFVDQRGTGLSEPIGCTKAAATYYQSTARPYVAAERDRAAADAETFAKDCIAEAGVAEADLPLFGTKQAVKDLEAVRDYLGADKLQLYGESYGTQLVQTYAAAYPDRIETLYLDGPVDLTVDGPSYYVEAARSATDTLVATLDGCTADATCKTDVRGGDALAVYDALATRLKSGPISFDLPLGNGGTERRELTESALEYGSFSYLYSRGARALLQRAIAAASHDDFVPLAKLYYDSLSVDPDTLAPVPDPTWSDAAYYAVECQDYAFYPTAGDPAARVAAWVDGARKAGVNDLRLATSDYGDLPCLYWPNTPTTTDRPAPLVDTPYPVVVLTSTTDPATPIANGMRIFSRLDDAYFFQAIGGPHVIYAWGDACPDDQMTALIADGTPPAARVTTCTGSVADEYVPNAALAKADYADALDLMQSMDDQIINSDDYAYRLDKDPISAGCDRGGAITFTPTATGTDMTLTACAFTAGVPLTGTGATDDEAGTFRLDVTIGSDRLEYRRAGDGATRVKGTYGGKKVDLKDAG